jgi:hypothetical protein
MFCVVFKGWLSSINNGILEGLNSVIQAAKRKARGYLFHSEIFSQLDVKDPLIQLANTINWTVFDDAFD